MFEDSAKRLARPLVYRSVVLFATEILKFTRL